jgi:hypothetical protein
MSLDDTDDYIDECGMFLEAPFVLTKEEYSSKVLFDKRLLQSIADSEFKEFFHKLDLPYDEIKNKEDDDTTTTTISFNFGDLLTHVPILERLKWKQFYRGTEDLHQININEAYKLLFFDIENTWELKTVKDYWRKKRIENLEETEYHQPWFTKKEYEQTFQELHYLNQFDQKTNRWRDLTRMDFRSEVLDKYRNNELCEIGSDYISFLRHDDDKKKTSASDVSFIIRNNVLMMHAKDFNNVPPIERSHWNSYQIQSEQTEDRR